MAAAHEAAAKCLESGKGEKVCLEKLLKDCKGVGIGKYCGMAPALRFHDQASVRRPSCTALPALAQHQAPPGVDPNAFKPLPERKDVVSWKLLSQVELVKQKDRYVPQFAGSGALDQKEVKVRGFMMPLQVGDKQSHPCSPRCRRAARSACPADPRAWSR